VVVLRGLELSFIGAARTPAAVGTKNHSLGLHDVLPPNNLRLLTSRCEIDNSYAANPKKLFIEKMWMEPVLTPARPSRGWDPTTSFGSRLITNWLIGEFLFQSIPASKGLTSQDPRLIPAAFGDLAGIIPESYGDSAGIIPATVRGFIGDLVRTSCPALNKEVSKSVNKRYSLGQHSC
jgi:hypothetical protein